MPILDRRDRQLPDLHAEIMDMKWHMLYLMIDAMSLETAESTYIQQVIQPVAVAEQETSGILSADQSSICWSRLCDQQ